MCSYLMLEIILFVSSRGGWGGGWGGVGGGLSSSKVYGGVSHKGGGSDQSRTFWGAG